MARIKLEILIYQSISTLGCFELFFVSYQHVCLYNKHAFIFFSTALSHLEGPSSNDADPPPSNFVLSQTGDVSPAQKLAREHLHKRAAPSRNTLNSNLNRVRRPVVCKPKRQLAVN